MSDRRYTGLDGGSIDDRSGRYQLARESTGYDGREGDSRNGRSQDDFRAGGQHDSPVGEPQYRSDERELGGRSGCADGQQFGRADGKSSAVAGDDRQRQLQRASQRSGGQTGGSSFESLDAASTIHSQLHALIANATDALARLDPEGLDALSEHALSIKLSGAVALPTDRLPELAARLRVFAAAMEATRSNLEFRTAISAPDQGGTRALGRMRWER
jgi:hypothetical protein